MRFALLPLLIALCLRFELQAQDTFSIVAVDTLTGEVGSAGASCLDNSAIAGGVLIISDVLPGKGAIHTQSFWNASNQANARTRMEQGDSPSEIMTWLQANDAQNTPATRQYGAVDFDSQGNPRTAAFTGSDCFDYKSHITGPNYAIQGNILLGQQILDSMEARFLNTQGSLSNKLMTSLQGANVPGADTRCLAEGVSSQSAFLRVAKPDDAPDMLSLHLVVGATAFGVEPIDELQLLYDAYLDSLDSLISGIPQLAAMHISVSPNPAANKLRVQIEPFPEHMTYRISNVQGHVLQHGKLDRYVSTISCDALTAGLYFLSVQPSVGPSITRRVIIQ